MSSGVGFKISIDDCVITKIHCIYAKCALFSLKTLNLRDKAMYLWHSYLAVCLSVWSVLYLVGNIDRISKAIVPTSFTMH